jgi:hypothetical protein
MAVTILLLAHPPSRELARPIKPSEIKASVTMQDVPPQVPDDRARAPKRYGRGIAVTAGAAGLALAVVSGGFSITGMTSISAGAY